VNPPIFVVNTDGSGVSMYEDLQRAEGDLEAIDVLNGEYEVFDSNGMRLRATAASDDAPVDMVEATDRTPVPEELSRILREHLRAVSAVRPELLDMSERDLSDAGLADLVLEMQVVDERFRQRSMASRIRRLSRILRGRLGNR